MYLCLSGAFTTLAWSLSSAVMYAGASGRISSEVHSLITGCPIGCLSCIRDPFSTLSTLIVSVSTKQLYQFCKVAGLRAAEDENRTRWRRRKWFVDVDHTQPGRVEEDRFENPAGPGRMRSNSKMDVKEW